MWKPLCSIIYLVHMPEEYCWSAKKHIRIQFGHILFFVLWNWNTGWVPKVHYEQLSNMRLLNCPIVPNGCISFYKFSNVLLSDWCFFVESWKGGKYLFHRNLATNAANLSALKSLLNSFLLTFQFQISQYFYWSSMGRDRFSFFPTSILCVFNHVNVWRNQYNIVK